MVNKKEILSTLLKNEKTQLSDEEFIGMLLEQNVTKNTAAEKPSFGQRAADKVAKFAGSWAFIISFLVGMVLWMGLNVLMATGAFDAYPFILLNLVLSCIAAVQAPLIMMSQNRQEEKDRARAENDYRVNLKNELLTSELYKRVEHVIALENKLLKELEKIREDGKMEV